MPSERPHIIFIITDQQRFDTIGALGFPYMDTPNLDRLVHEGVTFTNCHITAPSCAPSRASLFTGYYPHTTGILKNADRWTRSWVELLADAGYYCVNIGKMHTWPYDTPLGFHERYVVENKDRYLERSLLLRRVGQGAGRAWIGQAATRILSSTRRLSRAAGRVRVGIAGRPALGHVRRRLRRLVAADQTASPTQPLFMQIGFPGPHPPYDPTPAYAAPYMEKDLPLPQVTEEELAHSRRPSTPCASTTPRSTTTRSSTCSTPRTSSSTASAPTTSPTSP